MNNEKKLLNYCLRLTNNREQSKEIVQDAFVKLWNENFLKLKDYVVQWLYRVCRNQCMDYLRSYNLEMKFNENLNHEQLDEIQEDIYNLEDIFQHIESLPLVQKEIFYLKFQDGYSNQEISKITELSPSHIGVLIYRGMKEIREKINPGFKDE